jgi:MFS family permease
MVTFTPLFARDHGLENAGALFIVYAGMVIVMRLSLGRYMDRFPRSWFIVPGIGALAFSMLTMATASHIPQMFVAAGLYGAGAGTFQPAMMAHLVDQTQPAERGRALSTFTLGNDLGLSIGALLLGVLVDWAGYRPAFFVAGAMAASAALLFFASTRRQRGWKAAGATLQP